MRDALNWARWWADGWRHAHPDWLSCAFPGLSVEQAQTLLHHPHVDLGKTFGITPCLPCKPNPVVLHIALAQPAQRDFILALVNHTCRPQLPSRLNTEQQRWCLRLAKALQPHAWLRQTDDALQLLQAWVEPPIWQRIRLGFGCPRVKALEQSPPLSLTLSPLKLQALWQAVVWRANLPSEGLATVHIKAQDHALSTQD